MIEYEKRAMIEAEDKYTFRQSTQISMQTGLIGHLRADMDTDGNGFFSSWFDFREELKTDEFKAELDEVINSLREEGDILHNRRALAKYCYCTPQSRMQKEPGLLWCSRGYRKICLSSTPEPGQRRVQPVLLLLSPGLARSAHEGRRERNPVY